MGAGIGLWSLIAILLAELLFGGRVWCRTLCPLGGLYEVVGRVGVFRVVKVRDEKGCTQCLACKRACLADPAILDPLIFDDAQHVRSGDCLLCGACVSSCPQQILKIKPGGRGKSKERENELRA
jgi:ferredoxin-type protein NapH